MDHFLTILYHAGFCVLQERVIFQTHPGLVANTLKQTNLIFEKDIKQNQYFQVTQCSAKTWVDECEHILHKVVVSQWPQISWSTAGLIGPPWCSLYWLAFRLLLAWDWQFRLFTMPSCGHVSYKLVAMLTWVSFVLCLTCYNSALHMCLRCELFWVIDILWKCMLRKSDIFFKEKILWMGLNILLVLHFRI